MLIDGELSMQAMFAMWPRLEVPMTLPEQLIHLAVERDVLKDEVERLREDNDELNYLFDLQYKRSVQAEKWWQELTGKHDVFPDLGELLQTMLFVLDLGDALVVNVNAEVERLRKVAIAACNFQNATTSDDIVRTDVILREALAETGGSSGCQP